MEIVCDELIKFEQDASYNSQVELLNLMTIPKSIRSNKEDNSNHSTTKGKGSSTTSNNTGSNNKKNNKTGDKKANSNQNAGTVKSSAIHIGATHAPSTSNPDDLSTRHWSHSDLNR